MTSIERIADIIKAHDLDVLVVYAADGAKLDYTEGTDDAVTALMLIPESFDGIVTVEAYKAERGTVRGKKAQADKPFRWKVQGKTAAPMAAPVAAPAQVVKEVSVPDVKSMNDAAQSRADAQIAEHRRETAEAEAAELRGRIAALEAELDEVGDDDDDDEPEAMGAPSWIHDKETVLQMIGAVKDLFRPNVPAPPVAKEQGVTDTERQLLQAFRRFSASMPEQAKQTTETLLTNFGEQAPPPAPTNTETNDDGEQ